MYWLMNAEEEYQSVANCHNPPNVHSKPSCNELIKWKKKKKGKKLSKQKNDSSEFQIR